MITSDQKTARMEQLHTILQQKFVIYFFMLNKKLSIHQKTRHIFSFLFFMLKSQQKVDIKLSKICQSHQKTSRFTEIVVKTQENVGVVSSYLSGYFNSGPLEFSLARDNRQLNFNDTDVGSCKPCLGFLTLLALLV